jgi:hypothetical protein
MTSFAFFSRVFLCSALAVLLISGNGCASAESRQWSTPERIEQTLREKLPVGTAREAILDFFKTEGMPVEEVAPAERRPQHILQVSFLTDREKFIAKTLLVTFYLGKDGKLERMKTSESLTPL